MSPAGFVDYYELLQLSPNADSDTIHRVYRILAQRYHPDNQATGNSELFHTLSLAYKILCDAERRAAYDVEHRETRRLTWKVFDQTNSAQGVEAERRKRQGVLAVLYRKRISLPDAPAMALRDLEELLGIPKEHLEFTLWFLKEGQFVQRSDNARYVITLKGVELAEEMIAKRPEITPLGYLEAAIRAADTPAAATVRQPSPV